MNNKPKHCCICGKIFTSWGNNPWGALDKNGEYRRFKDTDLCCDDCNSKYVIPGRLAKGGTGND